MVALDSALAAESTARPDALAAAEAAATGVMVDARLKKFSCGKPDVIRPEAWKRIYWTKVSPTAWVARVKRTDRLKWRPIPSSY
jgi:hypothetical protein